MCGVMLPGCDFLVRGLRHFGTLFAIEAMENMYTLIGKSVYTDWKMCVHSSENLYTLNFSKSAFKPLFMRVCGLAKNSRRYS